MLSLFSRVAELPPPLQSSHHSRLGWAQVPHTGSTKLKKCSGRCPEHFFNVLFFNPKPNLYPFLDPGRVIPGNAGGPGPGRRAGSQNPNPLGGCAPQTPAPVSSGRSGVQRHICLSSYFTIPHPASYFLTSYFINVVNPVHEICMKDA